MSFAFDVRTASRETIVCIRMTGDLRRGQKSLLAANNVRMCLPPCDQNIVVETRDSCFTAFAIVENLSGRFVWVGQKSDWPVLMSPPIQASHLEMHLDSLAACRRGCVSICVASANLQRVRDVPYYLLPYWSLNLSLDKA